MRILEAALGVALLTAPVLVQAQQVNIIDPDSRFAYVQLPVSNQGGDNRPYRERFDVGQGWRSAGSFAEIFRVGQTFDCTPETEMSIGGQDFHILREIDGACIGSIGWAVLPDPQAEISLADGWCGDDSCGALELLSDSFEDEGWPRRFYTGQTSGPNLIIQATQAGWDDPVEIITARSRTRVRILPAFRPLVDDANLALPPIGPTYSLAEGGASTCELSADEDEMCLATPVAFAGSRRIVFNARKGAVRGNPYSTHRYVDSGVTDGANLVQAMIARYDGTFSGFRYIDDQPTARVR